MKKILKSYLITFISLFIFQESVNATECHGKVIGGPLSGKEGVRISKFHGDKVEILSVLNFDLKKASTSDVRKKWFDNYEKLNFKFPKVNTVKIIDRTGERDPKRGGRDPYKYQPDVYLIPKAKKQNEYWEIINNGEYWADYWDEVWPYLGSDDVTYAIKFNPYKDLFAKGSQTKCIFTNKHNSVLFPNGARYFAYEFSLGPQVYMIPKNNNQEWKMITAHALTFSYFAIDLMEVGGSIPGFEFK